MREIKFRVWSLKHKCWMNHCAAIDPNGNILSLFFEVTKNDNNEVISSTPHIVILPKEENIVQQFTGLVDKNKNPVYEGDIVSVRCYDDWRDAVGFNVTYLVKWCDIHKGFRGFTEKMLEESTYSGCSINELPDPIKILGNFCENPELLGL